MVKNMNDDNANLNNQVTDELIFDEGDGSVLETTQPQNTVEALEPMEKLAETKSSTDIDVNSLILSKNSPYITMIIVDDEESIHTLTELSLKHEEFAGKHIKFLHASSGKIACEMIKDNPNIAIVLLDVIMETKDAGLKVVDFIRKELKNDIIRIILRTGQPGDSPERDVISKYGINDYKGKTELTADKLYTCIYSAVREYNNIINVLQLKYEIELLNVFLNQLINHMPSALIAIDMQHKLTHWNNDTNKYSSAKIKLQVGVELYTAFPVLNKFKPFIEKSIASGIVAKQDSLEIESSTGSSMFFDLLVYPLIDKHLQSVGYVIRLDDVTKEEESRENVMQISKLISVGAMAAGIAHEIKNPLSIILNSSNNIQRRLSPELEQNRNTALELKCDLDIIHSYLRERKVIEFMSNITNASNVIGGIITNMLDYCRGSQNSVAKKVAVDSMVDKTLLLTKMDEEMHKKYKFYNIEIVKNIPNDLPEVLCHETEIEQVLYNLVRNSIQAMGDKLENRKIEFVASLINSYVHLECIDNGPGIKPEHLDKIFLPLFSTKGNQGNGLGLSICKEIMQKNRGDLVCESKFGEYTKFIITLPTPEIS